MTLGFGSSKVSACMAVDKTTAIIEMLAIGSAPMLSLGILAVVSRIWKQNLRSTLPWLRALRWILWLVGMIFVTATVLGIYRFDRLLLAVGGGLVSASIGLAVVEAWVKRHYAPELIPPAPDGYWPSPRDR